MDRDVMAVWGLLGALKGGQIATGEAQKSRQALIELPPDTRNMHQT